MVSFSKKLSVKRGKKKRKINIDKTKRQKKKNQWQKKQKAQYLIPLPLLLWILSYSLPRITKCSLSNKPFLSPCKLALWFLPYHTAETAVFMQIPWHLLLLCSHLPSQHHASQPITPTLRHFLLVCSDTVHSSYLTVCSFLGFFSLTSHLLLNLQMSKHPGSILTCLLFSTYPLSLHDCIQSYGFRCHF